MNGLVAPNTFIPLAEELRLIDALSGQLFGDSCRDAANWPEHVSLSFNFSPTQLSDKNFAQDVLTILADTGLPPYRLEAELPKARLSRISKRHVTPSRPCVVPGFESLLTILAPDIQVSPNCMN